MFLEVLAVLLFTFWLYCRHKDKLLHIPGPTGLPFIGSTLLVKPKKMHLVFRNLTRQYGSVYRFSCLFGISTVVVSDIKVATDALVTQRETFADRHPDHFWSFRYQQMLYGQNMIYSNWIDAKAMREIAHKGLRAFGSRLEDFTAIIQEEVNDFLGHIEGYGGADCEIGEYFQGAITNIVTTRFFGQRYAYSSPQHRLISEIDSLALRCLDLLGNSIIDMARPIRFLPIPSIQYTMQGIRDFVKARDHFFEDFVNPHLETLDRDHPRGIVDHIFIEYEQRESNILTEESFKGVVLDLILGGTNTSTAALTSLALVLVHHPGIQRKIQREIDEVVVDGTLPNISEKQNMPYTQAVVKEILRYATIGPFSIRSATKDTYLGGHFIPKGAFVVVDLWNIHHDPKYWEEPNKFDPKRFLDKDGKLRTQDSEGNLSYMPFGAGNRHCVGESVAKNRVFVILAALLQRYTIMPPDDLELLPSCHVESFDLGLTMIPPKYHVKLIPRE